MTEQDKQLLLQDLCTRLPYGVKVAIEYSKDKYTKVYDLREIDNDATSELRQQVTVWDYGFYSSVISYPLIDCRPYLRPISSMTEEEKKELLISILSNKEDTKYFQVMSDGSIDQKDNAVQELSNFTFHWINFDGKNTSSYIDWLNANHFDYRGLIEKGLAIEVTEENNPYD